MDIFQNTEFRRPESNNFDLSHDRKFSMNMGFLTPCMTIEVVPGDSMSHVSEQLARFAPMVSPVMHQIESKTEYFFVPNRLLWDGWEDFITNPTATNNPHPFVTANIPIGTVSDYLGYATGKEHNHNPFPYSAYALIYNEYYRDQNLIPELAYKLVDGDNTAEMDLNMTSPCQRRAWEHDYFTSCLPFAQKGDPVTLPFSGTAEVLYTDATGVTEARDSVTGTDSPAGQLSVNANGQIITSGGGNLVNLDNATNLIVDLESATSIAVNDLRVALRLQEFLEKNARGGTRYIENIKAHFGIKSSDSRLQRPEFLGGGKSNISISEVLQMSSSDSETPQGNMAGHGITVGDSRTFRRQFEEHGFIIGIMTVIPKTAYVNPMPKWSFRFDALDYLWPTFAHLGEQEVLSKEVDGQFGDNTIFGYIPRYSEYRFMQNTVHGDFKGNLDFWHLARKFSSEPVLNTSFIEANPDNRIFAVTEESTQKIYVHLFHRISARRSLPRYGIPTT